MHKYLGGWWVESAANTLLKRNEYPFETKRQYCSIKLFKTDAVKKHGRSQIVQLDPFEIVKLVLPTTCEHHKVCRSQNQLRVVPTSMRPYNQEVDHFCYLCSVITNDTDALRSIFYEAS